jgi:hypothetical protein
MVLFRFLGTNCHFQASNSPYHYLNKKAPA